MRWTVVALVSSLFIHAQAGAQGGGSEVASKALDACHAALNTWKSDLAAPAPRMSQGSVLADGPLRVGAATLSASFRIRPYVFDPTFPEPPHETGICKVVVEGGQSWFPAWVGAYRLEMEQSKRLRFIPGKASTPEGLMSTGFAFTDGFEIRLFEGNEKRAGSFAVSMHRLLPE